MTYEKLPDLLSVGDRIACPAHYPNPAIYEVFKVADNCVWLMNEAGVALHGNLTVELLRSYDYQKIVDITCPLV